MRKLNPARLLLPLALMCACASTAVAQKPVHGVARSGVDARDALATFPDSQAVLFIDARRIVNDVLPKFMTPADYRKMLKGAKTFGFDVRGLQFVAAGVRFNADAPAGTPPDFVVVVKGSFNADTMLMLGKVALAAQDLPSRTETYGSKTIEIMDAETVVKSVGKGLGDAMPDGEASNPKSLPYSELAVTALDSNTLALGVPSFVRSAVDASGGKGALRPDLLSLAAQDPNAVWSVSAELPPNLAEMARAYGMPTYEQIDDMVGWVKQLNISHGMTATDFTLGVAVKADTPAHASAFSDLVRMGQALGESLLRDALSKAKGRNAVQARQGLAMLASAVNRTEGDKLFLRVSVPQQTAIDLVKEQTAKVVKKPVRGTTRRRVRRR